MNSHIAIIESDRSLLSEVTLALENAGYLVSGFESLTTIEELASLHAGLFIIDEHLPAVSGHIICIMLHSNLLTRLIPQILTASSPLVSRFAELSEVNGSLRKPYAMNQLLDIVAAFLPLNTGDA